jgi:hypothetical protein
MIRALTITSLNEPSLNEPSYSLVQPYMELLDDIFN